MFSLIALWVADPKISPSAFARDPPPGITNRTSFSDVIAAVRRVFWSAPSFSMSRHPLGQCGIPTALIGKTHSTPYATQRQIPQSRAKRLEGGCRARLPFVRSMPPSLYRDPTGDRRTRRPASMTSRTLCPFPGRADERADPRGRDLSEYAVEPPVIQNLPKTGART